MKWTLLLVLLFVLTNNTEGQEHPKSTFAQNRNLINIAVDEVNKTFVSPPERNLQLKSASTAGTKIYVTYINFPEEAKQAFNYAVSIWETLIFTSVPIHIEAHWEKLNNNTLAMGRPSLFINNFDGAPLQNIYYPIALAEKLAEKELNSGGPDIICHFNSKFQWYFGTDGNTPATHYDFVSSILHEITHGLGFSGFFQDADEKGFFTNENNIPSIYDYFLFNNQNQQISDKSLFQSPSHELHKQLTSDNLKLCQASQTSQQNTNIDWVFAPSEWNEGTSLYHLKGYAYGEENGLMTPFAKKGEAIHNPGEITLTVLSELGWSSVSFDFDPLKDLEEIVAELAVNVSITSNSTEAVSEVKVIYSMDDFETSNSILLQKENQGTSYSGMLPLNNYSGKIQYYFEAKTSESRIVSYPSGAPSKTFTFRVGPDYYVPNLFHNPVKVVTVPFAEMNINAEATDNLGIKTVKVEYKINGILQEPIDLNVTGKNLYAGKIQIPGLAGKEDRLEYRIIAEDKSIRNNTRTIPAQGFQQVEVYSVYEPVSGYTTDFEDAADDFIFTDFSISSQNGFSGNILHTKNPYPVSNLENEKYNLEAKLKYPVIIEPDGLLSFDEIVLVEPGETGSTQNEVNFWDYVVVEASKDGGFNWLALSEIYDSGINNTWYSAFTKSFSNNTSSATPHESMFVNHTINLTLNTGLEAGDTVLFRFRMASDNSVNGWGWAIDNLEIQGFNNENEELLSEGEFQVYPNPASNYLFVEWSGLVENFPVEIVVTDLYGKTVCREKGIEPFYSPKTKIDLSGVSSGIYMVSINDGINPVSTNKIVKN